jgi:SAM-dependent methyltransferase
MEAPESAGLREQAANLFAAEDRHFWFRARNRVIGRVVRSLVAGLPPGYRVLEVGCGNGNVLRVLEEVCVGTELAGMDLAAEKLSAARQRVRCPLRQGDLHELPSEEPHHLIGMFDVLEHLNDDRAALSAVRQALQPGGRLLLTVPAHQSLWSYADENAGHCRRYSRAGLTQVLRECGYDVPYCSEFMMVCFPLMWLGRRLAALGRKAHADPVSQRQLFQRELTVVPLINGLLRRMLQWEEPLLARGWRLPIGASLLACAVRK